MLRQIHLRWQAKAFAPRTASAGDRAEGTDRLSDDLLLPQTRDLVLAETELRQHFFGLLAEFRRPLSRLYRNPDTCSIDASAGST
jgi:hypothetical protein